MHVITGVVVCGAVDDGKSTLIGRVLVETRSVPIDQVENPTGIDEIDYSLLTDGLEAEQEQGITIDVAYRHLALETGERFLLADSPGHEQYTRNMAVAASRSGIALLVVDVQRGFRTGSFRHAAIAAVMGAKRLIVAVNKIDLVRDAEALFRQFVIQGQERLADLGLEDITWVPTSGKMGVGLTSNTPAPSWYAGPTLLEALAAPLAPSPTNELRLPVQLVTRVKGDRWYMGRLYGGTLEIGSNVRAARGGPPARILEVRATGAIDSGTSMAIRLDSDIDIRRGDVLVDGNGAGARTARSYQVDLIWLDEKRLDTRKSYLLISGPTSVPAVVSSNIEVWDVENGGKEARTQLCVNEIGSAVVTLNEPILLDPYSANRYTGGFILVDRGTGRTVAAGLTRGTAGFGAVQAPELSLDRKQREARNRVRGCVIWLTGLSGSGKTTIADALAVSLYHEGIQAYVIDGDNLRAGINSDLDMTEASRHENVRRAAHIAKIMVDAGLVAVVALISPLRSMRLNAADIVGKEDFIEVYVDTSLDVCIQRDTKQLYSRAAQGLNSPMTGIASPYEPPATPALIADGDGDLAETVGQLKQLILDRRT